MNDFIVGGKNHSKRKKNDVFYVINVSNDNKKFRF